MSAEAIRLFYRGCDYFGSVLHRRIRSRFHCDARYRWLTSS